MKWVGKEKRGGEREMEIEGGGHAYSCPPPVPKEKQSFISVNTKHRSEYNSYLN